MSPVVDTPASAIYVGQVVHHRRHPKVHRFRHDVAMLYLDLDEIGSGLERRPLLSFHALAPLRYRDDDYLPDRQTSLEQAVRDRVEAEIGHRPTGPVRLLTQVRTWGHVFNPVSFYFCFDEGNESPVATLAEITNTPWKERHVYVVDHRDSTTSADARVEFDKVFHVSPFFDMDLRYRWRVGAPGEGLDIHMENLQHDRSLFTAALSLQRRPLTRPELAKVLLAHPWITLRIVASIHWHALRLWLKGVPFVPHPSKRVEEGRTS